MTNANDSTYPQTESTWDANVEGFAGGTSGGLTKREYFAAMALQGLLANSFYPEAVMNGATNATSLSEQAADFADELIKELNK